MIILKIRVNDYIQHSTIRACKNRRQSIDVCLCSISMFTSIILAFGRSVTSKFPSGRKAIPNGTEMLSETTSTSRIFPRFREGKIRGVYYRIKNSRKKNKGNKISLQCSVHVEFFAQIRHDRMKSLLN